MTLLRPAPTGPYRDVVTIDGASGSGKSGAMLTLGRDYGALPIEFGPVMRTVAYIAHQRRFTALDAAVLLARLESNGAVQLANESVGGLAASEISIEGLPYRQVIFASNVNEALATASAAAPIIELLAAMVRARIANRRVLLSGRQASTLVCPGAPLKICLTARSDVRGRRKIAQLRGAGLRPHWKDDVALVAPLSRFDLVIDTTYLTPDTVARTIGRAVEQRLGWRPRRTVLGTRAETQLSAREAIFER